MESETPVKLDLARLANPCRLAAFVARHSFVLVVGAIVVYAVFFSWSTILNHYTYHTYAYDLGIYMQSLWTTIHGYGLFYTSLWEGSRFVCHFEPVLIGVLPLYAAFPRAETLLVLQSVVLGAAAIPVYLLARQRLGSVVGLGFAVLYLMYPGVHGLNGFDFHATALAVPLLLSAHYCLGVGRLRTAVVFALVALTCRENVALVVFFMGVYWAWRWRRRDMLSIEHSGMPVDRRFLTAIGLALVALLWFVLAVNVAIPQFAQAEAHPLFQRYGSALSNLGVDPQGKLLYLVKVFGPLGFLSLLAPGPLLMSVPVFAQNLLSDFPHMYNIAGQNAALLIPWLFVSAIEGMAQVTALDGARTMGLRCRVLAMLLAVACVFALLYSNSPISLTRGFPAVDTHDRVVDEVVELLPAGASVFTQNDLFPHVCHRLKADAMVLRFRIDFFEYDIFEPQTIVERQGFDFEYILMDTRSDQSLFLFMTNSAWERLHSDYGVYARGDGVFLYRLGWTGPTIEMTAS